MKETRVKSKSFRDMLEKYLEIKGLDISEHGMEAYGGFQIFAND